MADPGESRDLSLPPKSHQSETEVKFDIVSLFEDISRSSKSQTPETGKLSDAGSNGKSDINIERSKTGKSVDSGFEPIGLDGLLKPIQSYQKIVELEPGNGPAEESARGRPKRAGETSERMPGLLPGLGIQSFLGFNRAKSAGTGWSEATTQIKEQPVFATVGNQMISVGESGLVSVDGNVREDGARDKISTMSVSLTDGNYIRDGEGRIVGTSGPSGSGARSFEYNEGDAPDKPSKVTIGDTTYVRKGPITSGGKPVQKDGYDMHNWSLHDSKGTLTGNWYGDIRISENGVFRQYFNDTSKLVEQGAGQNDLTAEQAKERDQNGIWPSQLSVTRPDGTAVNAKLKGKVVESLTETEMVGGKAVEHVWKNNQGVWTSDSLAGQSRKDLSLDKDGTIRYENRSGEKVIVNPDASSSVSKDGRVQEYDRYNQITRTSSEDGTSEYKYTVDSKGVSSLTGVDTTADGERSRWQKDPVSKTWKDEVTLRVAEKLRTIENGSIEFVGSDGLRSVEEPSLKQIDYDSQDRPVKVSFKSGAQRDLKYDSNGLLEVKDTIPVDSQVHESTWSREGKTDSFVSIRDNGKEYKRDKVEPDEFGDLKYRAADGREHRSESADLDKIARGEFVMGSESLLEARDRLVDSATTSGLDLGRFKNWMKEFEDNATKYKIDPEKVVKTMNNISDLLTEPSNGGPYNLDQRKVIADTLMHNLARPLEIDQGAHPTCNVTSVEVYAAVRHPDAYSGLISEASLTGKWKALTGKVGTPPLESLKPGKDETSYDPSTPDSGKRSLASQVFQMTLINTMYETGEMNSTKDDRSQIRYIMKEEVPITSRQGNSVITTYPGEDTLVKNGVEVTNNGKKINGPEMIQDNVLRSCEILFGEKPPHIENAAYFTDNSGRRQYSSDLISKERLFEAKQNNLFPILTPTMGGNHAQTLHDVWQNPKDGQVWVLLDNQHGEPEVKGQARRSGEGDGDGWITLDTLHKTLRMSAEGQGYGQPVMPMINKYDHPQRTK